MRQPAVLLDRRYRFDAFEVDLWTGEIRRNGIPVALQEQPFQLLAALLEKPGTLVSHECLKDRLWTHGVHVDFEGSLATAVRKLRRALGDSARYPRYVETLPGRGYRFLAPVLALTEAPADLEDFPTRGKTVVRDPRRWPRVLAAGLLAAGVAMALLLPQGRASPSRQPTRPAHPEAFLDSLRGRFFWSRHTPEGWEKGIACFRAALARDPLDAPAYAGLADCQVQLGVFGHRPAPDCVPAGIANLQRALDLDPHHPGAVLLLGFVRSRCEGNHPKAEAALREGLELEPRHAVGRMWLGQELLAQGRTEEALLELRRAAAADPVCPPVHAALAEALFLLRRWPAAIAQARAALELDPQLSDCRRILIRALAHHGEEAEAVAQWRLAAEAGPGSGRHPDGNGFLSVLAEQLRQENAAGGGRRRDGYRRAVLLAELGETDAALDALRRAVQDRDGGLLFLGHDPAFDPLRSRPDFQALLRSSGLATPQNLALAAAYSRRVAPWAGRGRSGAPRLASR